MRSRRALHFWNVRSEERRVGKECRSLCDWSSDVCSSDLTRDEVFITNVVKSRPPGNRDPLPDEIAACAPFLERQIEVIDPDVIVTLGRFSMARWFPGERISRIHGQPKRVGRRLIVPMYH